MTAGDDDDGIVDSNNRSLDLNITVKILNL